MGDFAPSEALRLWEYGVGDRARRSASVNLRRVGPNEYELTTDVDVTLGESQRHVTAGEVQTAGGPVKIGGTN
jgi:hypothetical protein